MNRAGLTLALALLAAAQAIVLCLALWMPTAPSLPIVAQLALSLCAMGAIKHWAPPSRSGALLLAAGLGPIAVLALWLGLGWRSARQNVQAKDRRVESKRSARQQSLQDRIEGQTRGYAVPDGLVSFHRLLRHGHHAERQAVVGAVVRGFDVRLAPLILRALGDRDQSVRAQAAAAATEITRQVLTRRERLRRATDRRERLELLAEHGTSNLLLSETMRQDMLREAVQLMRNTGDPHELVLLAQIAVHRGDHERGAALIRLAASQTGGRGAALGERQLASLLRARRFASIDQLVTAGRASLPQQSLFARAAGSPR